LEEAPPRFPKNVEHMNTEIQNSPAPRPEAGPFPAAPTPTESDLLCQELAEQKELNLQLIEDFENFKRRSRQEGEARAAAQKESFIQDLLPFIDNLERALASGAAPGSLQFHQGVEMTLQQLRQLLMQHGIEIEESVGKMFDPHRHEAVSQRRDPAQADRAILEVFQCGYRRGEKVFRPAKVVVNDLAHPKRARHAR
jgi:molecular chaperone GrpE